MKNQLSWLRNAVCLLLSLVVLNSCSSSSGETTSEPDTAAEAPKSEIYTVEIKQMQFIPAELKVKKGDKVVFVNRDLVAHNITEEASKSWSSSTLQNGEYWVLEVTESSDYYCSLHPVMKGKIVAE